MDTEARKRLNMKKKDRIAKIAKETIQREKGPASTDMIWEAVNNTMKDGAFKAAVYAILKGRKEFQLVNLYPSMWDLNESIDADESLGVN